MALKRMIFDRAEFSKAVRYKLYVEENDGLRNAAEATGLSIATLSRLANGGSPDIDTFATACIWMDKNPDTFFIKKAKK